MKLKDAFYLDLKASKDFLMQTKALLSNKLKEQP